MMQTLSFLNSAMDMINNAAQTLPYGEIVGVGLAGIVLLKLYSQALETLMGDKNKKVFAWVKKQFKYGFDYLNRPGRYDVDSPLFNKLTNYGMAFTHYAFALCFSLCFAILLILLAIKAVTGFWNFVLVVGVILFLMAAMRIYKVHGDENLYKARNGLWQNRTPYNFCTYPAYLLG